jgi:hypothetical protein
MEIDVNAIWPLKESTKPLHSNEHTIRRHIDAGNIRAIRIGGRIFIPAEEIARIQREGLPVPFSTRRQTHKKK